MSREDSITPMTAPAGSCSGAPIRSIHRALTPGVMGLLDHGDGRTLGQDGRRRVWVPWSPAGGLALPLPIIAGPARRGIHQQDLMVGAGDPDRVRDPVDDALQEPLLGEDRVLGALDLGDVQQDHAAGGRDLPGQARALATDHQPQVSTGLGRAPQRDLEGLLLAPVEHARQAGEQDAHVPRGEPRAQDQVRYPPALHPQQLGGGQVHLGDLTLAVEGGVGDRGKVIQVGVAVAGLLQGALGVAQFPVLEFQLDLVDLQVQHQGIEVSGVRGLAAQGVEQFREGVGVEVPEVSHCGIRVGGKSPPIRHRVGGGL